MKKLRLLIVLVMALMASAAVVASTPQQTKALTDFLDRIGGPGASKLIVMDVDPSLSTNGKERFVITSQGGKPAVKGSSMSAVTTGINWYLNHYAHINLSWNNLTTDLSKVTLPVPTAEESHECSADYRYYLNYCTFSYSMSTWTWDRWQKEIDWMALHGINMPLQIVGLDVVWRNLLTKHYGYTPAEADAFVAGPCFQAWWGMNNLQGWGGPNPDWWYERQADLARKILARERELGIDPVIPGYSGSVPDNFYKKTRNRTKAQGGWCGFTRPHLLDPNSEAFAEVSANYYKELEELMGTSAYYSMDPFHEGANTSGIDVPSAYRAIGNAMLAANPEAKWVIQFWQWSNDQYNVLDQVEKGKLVILDLFSDGHTHFNTYKSHDAVYCTLNNFGGRTGMMGRVNKVVDGYFDEKAKNSNIKGIGATPEAIEQVGVHYDIFFELPWYASKPDAKAWMEDYALARYGVKSPEAAEAWELLRNSALSCPTALQGPHEAVMCGRPALTINSVSTWGGSTLFYDPQDVISAAYKLLNANITGGESAMNNYSYDIVDVTRQTMSDYSKALLDGIRQAHESNDTPAFEKRRDAFLSMMLDVDRLLNTHPDFMLGHWTEMARDIASESSATTEADASWLEHDNARTLITTWGPRASSENGGLRDYSYRQWGGMMKDFYYQRWKNWFDSDMKSTDWFTYEWDWAHNNTTRYPTAATGNSREVAEELLAKYLSPLSGSDNNVYYLNRGLDNSLPEDFTITVARGNDFIPALNAAGTTVGQIAIDFDNNKRFSDSETSAGGVMKIAADAPVGRHACRITLADGTVADLSVVVYEQITEPRTVSVATENPAKGSVSIDGTDALKVTNTDYVVIRATPAEKYDFSEWVDAQGKSVSTDNPYTYYGKENASFTARFVENKWGIPPTNYKDRADIESYKQYVKAIDLVQNGATTRLYSTEGLPEKQFNYIQQRIKAAPGGEFEIDWSDAGGLRWLFLSAYLDYNADGKFNKQNELLCTLGKHRNNNNADVAKGVMKVVLPFDAPKGVTHMRLRFDSSWLEPWDEATGAYDANQTVTRFAYEFLVELGDSPEYESKVSVKPNNHDFGSVSIDRSTYLPGEKVVIFSYPSEGYRTAKWVDQHGRTLPTEWMDGNSLTFTVYDNAEITAIFEPSESSVSRPGDDKRALLDGNRLTVSNLNAGDTIRLVNLSGQTLSTLTATSSTATLTLPSPGAYFIATPLDTIKIVY